MAKTSQLGDDIPNNAKIWGHSSNIQMPKPVIMKNKDANKIKQEYKTMQMQKIKELTNTDVEEEKQIIEENYNELMKSKMQEIQEITKTINRLESQTEKQKIKNIKTAIQYFDDIIESDKPSKQALAQVLDKIIIYKGKRLEFKLKVSIDKLL